MLPNTVIKNKNTSENSLPDDFVILSQTIPGIIQDLRYCSDNNFIGTKIDGYEEPFALMTKKAAEALKQVSDELENRGYKIKVYDAYRPQRAVDHFVSWAKDLSDTRMKNEYYPNVDKSRLFEQGYIAEKSGHSRGSTIDLTLVNAHTGKELDMGGSFDYFGDLSHSEYTEGLTDTQISNRKLLKDVMQKHGFKPLDTEWWHFTLANEPYPDKYFDFPVRNYTRNRISFDCTSKKLSQQFDQNDTDKSTNKSL